MIKPMDFVLSKNDKTEPDLSFNDKSEQPHNTREIIAESLGNKQDLLEIGRQREAQKGKEGREIQLEGLLKNDKPSIYH